MKNNLSILLWAYEGAGLHYWGPGMSAYNLYNSALEHKDFNLELAHGYKKQAEYKIYDRQHLISPITTSIVSHPLFLYRAHKWLQANASRFDVLHGLSTFHVSFMPAYWMIQKGKPSFLKIIGTNAGLKKSSLPSRLLGWEANRKKHLNDITAYIAISNEIKDELLDSGVLEHKIHLIPNGVNTSRFKPPDLVEKLALRNKLGIANKFTFVFTGGVSSRKKPSLIVEACIVLKERGIDFQFLLIGPTRQDKTEGQKVSQLIEQNNLQEYVIRHDFISQIEDVYKISDVFILPSSKEGMSNSILEAMSTGLPSIVTPVSGMGQLIFEGRTGTYISQNVRELADAMIFYLQNIHETKKRGNEARVLIEREFSSKAILNRHLDLFRNSI